MSTPCLWCGRPFGDHDLEQMRACVDELFERVQGMVRAEHIHAAEPTCPPHRFQPRSWRWLRRRDSRWVCVVCGYLSRHYDGLDRYMTRPVHPKMSVAYRGVNTVGRDSGPRSLP